MKKYLLFPFLFASLMGKSNDFPVQYSVAGQLFPTTQSVIELHKEILKFTLEDDFSISTNVYFEFYNPTDSIINLDVAFVDEGESVNTFYRNGKWRRYTNWDYWDMEENPDYSSEIIDGPGNNIIDFKVSLDGKELDYEIKGLDKEYKEFGYSGYEILYIFNARFPPGKTIIEHSYTLLGGDREAVLEYILTSGKQWANGMINDFTLEFHIGEYFVDNELKSSGLLLTPIGDSVLWNSILQDAKLITRDNMKFKFDGNIYENTFMQFKKKDFIPNKNIFIYRDRCKKELYLDKQYQEIFEELYSYNLHNPNYSIIKSIREKIKKIDERILKNCLFAFYNYKFQSEYLTSFFGKYEWYQADKDVPKNINIFSDEDLFIWKFINESNYNTNCPNHSIDQSQLYKILINKNNIIARYHDEYIPLKSNELLKTYLGNFIDRDKIIWDNLEQVIYIKERGASKETIEQIISIIHNTYQYHNVAYKHRKVCYNQNIKLINEIKPPPPPPNQRK